MEPLLKVRLECLSEGRPAPQYAWVKVDPDMRENLVGVGFNTLNVDASSTNFEGQYLCKVFVEGFPPINSRSAFLSLLKAPVVEMKQKGVVEARVGESAVLQCEVDTTSENTSVVWTRVAKNSVDINLVSSQDRITKQSVLRRGDGGITLFSQLVLPEVTAEDFSAFGCFAQNEMGSDLKMVVLRDAENTFFWISLIVAGNTLIGLAVLAAILLHRYKKNMAAMAEVSQFPRETAVAAISHVGEFERMLGRHGMCFHENITDRFPGEEVKIDLGVA